MTIRHATALTLVGWYLIVPPRGVESNGVLLQPDKEKLEEALKNNTAEVAPDPTQPYSDWLIMSSYDTGEKCEQERSKFHEIATHAKERDYRDAKGQQLPDQLKISTKQYGFAICFSTDDPRLKKN